MIAPLKSGVTWAQPDGPVIETERLKLRMWRGADIEPNTAMLADPASGRFITSDGKPITGEEFANVAGRAGRAFVDVCLAKRAAEARKTSAKEARGARRTRGAILTWS